MSLHSARVLLAVGVGLVVAGVAQAAPRLRGPDVLGLATSAVSAVKMHQQAMAAQVELDEVPFFFELAARGAPALFERSDGVEVDGGLTRYGLSMGGGFGSAWEYGGFAGVQYDTVSASSFPNLFEPAKGLEFDITQALLYAGASFYGFQISYGAYLDPRVAGFDAAGGLESPGSTGVAYAGTEESYRLMTLQSVFGLSGDATWLMNDDGSRKLEATRFRVNMKRLMVALDAETLGIPVVALERFAKGVDYFGDRFADATQVERDDTVYVPVELTDVMGSGFGVRAVTQVAPEVLFRLAELRWLYRVPGVIVEDVLSDFAAGGRAQVFRRGAEYVPSADVYLAIQPDFYAFFSMFGAPWMALSYSYNSPDSGTFFALPDTHILGIQLVYGAVEMARPLLPISPAPTKRSRADDW